MSTFPIELMTDEPTPIPLPTVPTIYYEHIKSTAQVARFKKGADKVSILDVRFRRQPGVYNPDFLNNLYKTHYWLIPSLGTQGCVNGEAGRSVQVIDWRRGLGEVDTALTPRPLYSCVLCDCVEIQGYCHRWALAGRLAQTLGLAYGGLLP
jgi:hypothetical protein